MAINATFGTVEYREGGVIAIPLAFPADVIVPSKSVCQITHISGSDLTGVTHRVIGKGRAFEVVFAVPPDRSGRFQISAVGDVLKTSTNIFDNVVATPITVMYATMVPEIGDFDIPASYALGSPVDIFVAYNIIVTGWNANNTITNPGIFELEGADLGTPSAYKWVGSSVPDFKTLSRMMPNLRNNTGQYDINANNAALLNLGWQVLDTPPAGVPATEDNNFDDDGTWHGESGQYFLVRFSNPQEPGIFNLTERPGIVRGPVS